MVCAASGHSCMHCAYNILAFISCCTDYGQLESFAYQWILFLKKREKKWIHISFLLWSFQSFRISTTLFVATFAQKSYVSYFVYFCLFSKQKRFHAWLLPAVSRTSVGGKGLLLPCFWLFFKIIYLRLPHLCNFSHLNVISRDTHTRKVTIKLGFCSHTCSHINDKHLFMWIMWICLQYILLKTAEP